MLHCEKLAVFVHVPPGTRVYVQLEEKWQGKVDGLCGTFDDMAANDFTTSTGVLVTSAYDFASSYKVMSTCSDIEQADPCTVSSST